MTGSRGRDASFAAVAEDVRPRMQSAFLWRGVNAMAKRASQT